MVAKSWPRQSSTRPTSFRAARASASSSPFAWCSNERFIAGSIVAHDSTPVDEGWRRRFATGLERVDSSVTEPVDSLPALLDAPQCLAPVALGGQPL